MKLFSRTQRYLAAELGRVEAGRLLPAQEMIEKLLAFARPALEEAEIGRRSRSSRAITLARGNGARRQREVYGRAGQFEDVVDMLIEETSQGMAEAS